MYLLAVAKIALDPSRSLAKILFDDSCCSFLAVDLYCSASLCLGLQGKESKGWGEEKEKSQLLLTGNGKE